MEWHMCLIASEADPIWVEGPDKSAREAHFNTACRLVCGEFYVRRSAGLDEMDLLFDGESAVLFLVVASGEVRLATLPRRHRPAAPLASVVANPLDHLKTHGIPRREAFALMREFLSNGLVPSSVPPPSFEQQQLPGMEGFGPSSAELRQVEWVLVDVS